MESGRSLLGFDDGNPGVWSMASQLIAAVLLPAILLLGLTFLLATGRISLTAKAQWLLARQNSIWMGGVVALVAAGALYIMGR